MTVRYPAAALVLTLLSGCKPPKYASYVSVSKDFTASVPWGWQVMAEAQGDSFAQVNFIGPFDPDFYLGAPSLSVRWYRRYRPRRLRDGRLEVYSGAEDFYRQMLRDVYPGRRTFVTGIIGRDERDADGPSEITLQGSGLKASYVTVLSPTPAPPQMQWGVSEDKGTGKPFILRRHSYALVTVADGFYVLCYPATQRGYERYADRFRALIGSFTPLTAGPGGEKFRVPGPSGRS